MLYIFIVASVVTLDLATKKIIDKKFRIGQTKEVVKDKVYLHHVKNSGAAFGIFSDKPRLLKILSFSSVILLFYYALHIFKYENSKLQKSFLSMIIGGAAGNLYDRFKNKRVTDFLFFKIKNAPVFNIADIFILIGSLGVFFSTLRTHK